MYDHFSHNHFTVDDAMGTYLRPATLQKADMVLDLLEGNEETASQELKWKDLLRSAEQSF